jgi:ankyrin repeat protein
MIAARPAFVVALLVAAPLGGCAIATESHHQTEDYTSVFAAAAQGDLATLRRAVDSDPDLVKAHDDWDRATLLHDAVQQNHLNEAAYLIAQGAEINAVTNDGLTPLHMAAQNGNTVMARLLLQHGANLNAVDGKGWTPLDRAEKWQHAAAAAFLRRWAADKAAAL